MSDSSSLENEAGPGESAEARRGGDMGSPGVGVMLPTEELLSPFSKLEENVVNDDTISTIFYLSYIRVIHFDCEEACLYDWAPLTENASQMIALCYTVVSVGEDFPR